MKKIVSFNSSAELDSAIIPNVIYSQTINREKTQIQNYFILHPKLLYSFVGFNGTLKLANQLASNKKCGCFYTLPWVSYYEAQNNFTGLTLSFNQQVDEYRYMILNWYPSPNISNMQYLSEIALTMILDISQFWYYQNNNLETCKIFQQKYYLDNFPSQRAFINYLNLNVKVLDNNYKKYN